jgi:hypothetical protein
MNTRQTRVAWDPKLVRVEYLDEQGNPYYCLFAASDRAAAADATTQTSEAAGHPGGRGISGQPANPCPPFGPRPDHGEKSIRFSTRRVAMVILTGAVGEEIIIDGRIRIRILAISGEEVYLEVNFPEFLRSGYNGAHGQQDESRRRWDLLPDTPETAP